MRYNAPRYLLRRFEVMRLTKGGETFLEIGPGNLNLALEMLSKFKTGTLLDFNTTDVEEIYNSLAPDQKQRLKLIVADFLEYDQFTTKFNGVVTCEVMEHVEKDILFLEKINHLLEDGGQLILSVPARQIYWSVSDEIVGHFRRYEKQELHDKLAQTGFENIKIVSYGFPFILVSRVMQVILAKIQVKEKGQWDKKTQSQKSSFFLDRKLPIHWLSIFVNKYTFLPLNLFAIIFNNIDISEGYVVSATKRSVRK